MPPWIADHNGDNYPLVTRAGNSKELLITMPKNGTLVAKRYSANGSTLDRYTLAPADGLRFLMADGNEHLNLIGWTQASLDTVSFDTRRKKFVLLHVW